jgi:hypothetical protein
MRQYIINVEICSWCPNCKEATMKENCRYCVGEKFTGTHLKNAHYHFDTPTTKDRWILS